MQLGARADMIDLAIDGGELPERLRRHGMRQY
jgi:hypothetical protein